MLDLIRTAYVLVLTEVRSSSAVQGGNIMRYRGSHVKKKGAKGSAKASKKKSKLLPTLGIVVVVVVLLFVVAKAFFSHYYNQMNIHTGLSDDEIQQAIENYNPEDYREEGDLGGNAANSGLSGDAVLSLEEQLRLEIEKSGGETLSDNNIINILLIGTDSRTNEVKSRSDTMMLVSVNKKTEEITLTSFARDIYTYIPALGYSNRLNVPCAVGGPTMLLDTMKQVFGIEIDGYIMVNFFSFIDVVDALGGVDVELREAEIEYLNKNLNTQNELLGKSQLTDHLGYGTSGMVHLNGNQALAYARIRQLDGDTMRTARQRSVITALINKAKGLSLQELNDLAKLVLPMVTTNLTQTECMSMLVNALEYFSYDIQTLSIPQASSSYLTMIDGMSVFYVDFYAEKLILKEEIFGITE
ncbi:MAG: LytR family transcriptional regulator [Ruminococcaceae bacterium]|nr:LytR family transcriptional regulator [Oscillospiraceae bacterium]